MPTYSIRNRPIGTRRRGIKDGACPKCGQPTTREKVFFRGPDTPRIEAVAELEREIEAWEPDFTHDRCR